MFRVLFPILCLVLLLASPAVAVAGAAQGLLLWFNVVLPTLAPFLICTRAVSASGGLAILMRPFAPLLHRLFGLSREGSYALLCGLLCGYPLGAKLCADFYADGSVSRSEAQYLLAICNHPSPMFLLGYVHSQLGNAGSPVLLLTCLYLPVLPLSLLARSCYRFPHAGRCGEGTKAAPEPPARNPSAAKSQATAKNGLTAVGEPASGSESLDEILMSACETMVMIGGYIMLFSILAAWIRQLRFLPLPLQTALAGAAEITTGVRQICSVLPPRRAVLPTLLCVAFGGFSGLFQTRSVIVSSAHTQKSAGLTQKNAGLSIRHYLIWKLMHAALTGAACILLTSLQ